MPGKHAVINVQSRPRSVFKLLLEIAWRAMEILDVRRSDEQWSDAAEQPGRL